jgi:hypothetical protein
VPRPTVNRKKSRLAAALNWPAGICLPRPDTGNRI